MATIYETGKLYMVPLAEMQDDPRQPRKYMDPVKLEEMTASVKRVGIIQPVVCRQDPATSPRLQHLRQEALRRGAPGGPHRGPGHLHRRRQL